MVIPCLWLLTAALKRTIDPDFGYIPWGNEI
jgi:hypothetical protein